MGLPAFTAREIEKECLDLERRRSERKVEIAGQSAKKHNVRQSQQQEVEESSADDSYPSSSSDEDIATGDEATGLLINEIKVQQKKYQARGRAFDPRKIYKRAVNRYNQKYVKPGWRGKDAHHGARQAQGGNPSPFQGPPGKLPDGQRKNIIELLALANCSRGQCVQCGNDGHYMHSDACALKDKQLKDRPCAKCGKGLHAADECPRVFQQKYVGPQGANVAKEESLNDQ